MKLIARGLYRLLDEFVVPSLLVLCAACGDARPTSTAAHRDSAGVRIVESTAPRWKDGDAWTVDSAPTLDLTVSGSGPEHEFFRVFDATRLRDGSIAVANYGSREVRLFSATGEFLRSFGREGEGPGEFRRLNSLHPIHGDSLLAFDNWLGRVTIFDLESGGSRTFGSPDSNTRLDKLAPLSNGMLAGIEYVIEQIVPYGLYRMPYAVTTRDLTGAHVDTVARMPGFEGFQFETGDARPLFGKNGHMAVHGERIYLGYGDSLEVAVYGNGALELVMRVPGYDLRLSAAELAAERHAATPAVDMPAHLRDVFASMPDPETRPAYATLLVDASGYVWAPEFHGRVERDLATDYVVFSPDGEWLGSVRLPPRFTLYEVGADYVLGVRTDELVDGPGTIPQSLLIQLWRTPGGDSARGAKSAERPSPAPACFENVVMCLTC